MRVVIAGGGVAALEATLALRALAPELVDIELLAPESEFVYRPLAVAEPFLVGEVRRFPLLQLAEAAGARLRKAIVTGSIPAAGSSRRRRAGTSATTRSCSHSAPARVRPFPGR